MTPLLIPKYDTLTFFIRNVESYSDWKIKFNNANNQKVTQELINPHQAIGVFTTIQINQQKTTMLVEIIPVINQLIPQPLPNNIGGGFGVKGASILTQIFTTL